MNWENKEEEDEKEEEKEDEKEEEKEEEEEAEWSDTQLTTEVMQHWAEMLIWWKPFSIALLVVQGPALLSQNGPIHWDTLILVNNCLVQYKKIIIEEGGTSGGGGEGSGEGGGDGGGVGGGGSGGGGSEGGVSSGGEGGDGGEVGGGGGGGSGGGGWGSEGGGSSGGGGERGSEEELSRENNNLITSCILFLITPSSFSAGNPIATMLGLISDLQVGVVKNIIHVYVHKISYK